MENSTFPIFEDGQTVTCRLALRDNEAGDAPEWGPWRELPLYVQCRADGTPVIYKPRVPETDWAEYSPENDYCGLWEGNHQFLCENYRMEIKPSLFDSLSEEEKEAMVGDWYG